MIYLDNSATTKQDPQVTKAMMEYMDESFGNPSSLHHSGLVAEKAVKKARGQIADSLGKDQKKGRIIFGAGGTEANNTALFGAARSRARMGKRIVVSSVEHPAVLECCRALEEEGFEIVRIGVDRNCRIAMDELEDAVDDKTILVSLMQVNNEVGTIMAVDEAAEVIGKKQAPAVLHCDSVQSFCKIPVPDKADMISISGHKIHGPKGSGALWIKEGIRIRPLIYGGGQEDGLRSGTENVPGIVGFGVAADLMSKKMSAAFDRAVVLRNRLMDGLKKEISDVVINSPESCGKTSGLSSPYILNVSFMGTRGEVILHSLEQEGVYVSTGSACSSNKRGRSHVLEAMGCRDDEIEGAIRFSICDSTTPEEIDEAVEKTAEAVGRFRRLGSLR